MLSSNSLQSFKQVEQKTSEILHFHFFTVQQVASVTSYLNENEARNLQNGDVHLAQIPVFKMAISREPFGALRSMMVRCFAFFTLFHLSLT